MCLYGFIFPNFLHIKPAHLGHCRTAADQSATERLVHHKQAADWLPIATVSMAAPHDFNTFRATATLCGVKEVVVI